MKLKFTFSLLSVLFLGCMQLNAQKKASTANRPNILFILSDDHSVPYLGCYGNKDLKTPNLDRIAASGMRFNRMYVTSPQCTPSRSSLFAGRAVTDIQQTRFASPMKREIPVYPELLRKGGYYTGIGGRVYHTDGAGGSNPAITRKVIDEYKLAGMPDKVDFLRVGGRDTEVLNQLKEFLNAVPANRPWFLQTGYNNPHRPFTAPEFAPDPEKLTIPAGMPDTKELRKDLAAHYGEIHQLDHFVGQLIAELESRGALKNTVIVFMGDNGAALWRGKGSLWETGLHVPLLVSWPSVIKPGSVSDLLLSGEDIAPTMLNIAGITPPTVMTGKSFLPTLKGSNSEIREYAFAERGAHGQSLPTNTGNFDLSRAVFNKKYKLIYNALWQLPFYPVDYASEAFWLELTRMNKAGELDNKYSTVFKVPRPMFELYDLEADPLELNNLAGNKQYAATEKTLKETMQKWMILNWDYLPLPIPKS